MQCLVFDKQGLRYVAEYPQPQAGETLIRVIYAGLL